MQLKNDNNPTFRMQVFYLRNRWHCFIKPAIQKKIDAVTNLVSRKVQQHIAVPVSAGFKHVNQLRVNQSRFAAIMLAIVTLVVAPNVCPDCNAPGARAGTWADDIQTVTANDSLVTLYDRGGIYKPTIIYPVGNVEISSHYGWRVAPCPSCSSDHQGTDFHVPGGTPVHAAMTGTVVTTGWEGSLGYHMVIDDGHGYVTYYAHMIDGSTPAQFTVGSRVNMGDVVGLVGCTGACTGAHLHFGLQLDGSFVDPMPVLQRYAQ
jgi:murein DD-endopeptidase MepM/ murein hydrolase activator NlpD